MRAIHTPVLLEEVLESFDTALIRERGGILIDCTLGLGGHSKILLQKYPKLKLIGIDQDRQAIENAWEHLRIFGDRVMIEEGRFSEVLKKVLHREVVGVLADIGISSLQVDDKQRGFSFDSHNLDMRMNPDCYLDAKKVVNTYSLHELERIFRDFGEMREYKKAAHLVVESRKQEKITSAKTLSQLFAQHFKSSKSFKIHPATLPFQAIRIEVNDELGELERMLKLIGQMEFQSGARVGIITFHSLEDRRVKTAFKGWERSCICSPQVT
ncbi:MAG: 16S rRNA (cytosine(1402)-N(4))-methyltransferase RsmH, partial [Helicobacter sp.]|nr:16S rRNA (cytosine(1402)-N(4))-methyltransferase RsmH [Helicobacter sp.]